MPAAAPAVLSARILEWDREKGYGFIGSGSERIFLHRRDFKQWHRTPVAGGMVQFTLGRDREGRRCALNAVQTPGRARSAWGSWLMVGFLLIIPGVAGWVYGFDTAPWLLLLLGWNGLTYRVYAVDKRCAIAGSWRVPELTLHLLEALGGWPAAFLAQRRLRHKCSKRSYQFTFWLIVLVYQLAAYDSLRRWKYSRAAWQKIEAMVRAEKLR